MISIPTVESCGPFKLNICGLMIGFLQLGVHLCAFLVAVRIGSGWLAAMTCKCGSSFEPNEILYGNAQSHSTILLDSLKCCRCWFGSEHCMDLWNSRGTFIEVFAFKNLKHDNRDISEEKRLLRYALGNYSNQIELQCFTTAGAAIGIHIIFYSIFTEKSHLYVASIHSVRRYYTVRHGIRMHVSDSYIYSHFD